MINFREAKNPFVLANGFFLWQKKLYEVTLFFLQYFFATR